MSNNYNVDLAWRPVLGRLEVIAGCMFSGKSTELIKRLTIATESNLTVAVFKPLADTRYGPDAIVSHNCQRMKAQAVSRGTEILKRATEFDVIGLDESQFYDKSIISVCQNLVINGKLVIAAGLDLDFLARPFGSVPILMAYANRVDKLEAVCSVCGRPATRSQRLVDGVPASSSAPLILIGASESYEPRCVTHYQVASF